MQEDEKYITKNCKTKELHCILIGSERVCMRWRWKNTL